MRHTVTTDFLKICDDPLIYVISSGWGLISGFKLCLNSAGTQTFHVLVRPSWNILDRLQQYETFARTVAALNEKIKVSFLCNNERETSILRARGLDAIHCHSNAFIDERIYRPYENAGKRFNAIHIAALPTWKRHELAWDVPNICVVTYRHQRSDDHKVILGYKDLAYTNLRADSSVEFLAPERVAELTSKSYCGLILSATEGQSNASAEYQFCGIPTITTPSSGGRAEFLDRKSTIVVPPDPVAIRKAVEFLVKTPFDPGEIRRRAIERSIPHRVRLIDWMSRIVGYNLHDRADQHARLPEFKDKLRERVRIV